MTTMTGTRPHPTPRPHPGAATDTAGRTRGGEALRRVGRVTVRAGQAAETVAWVAYDAVVRHPRSAAAVAVAVTATTPVTVGDVAGVVVAGASACGVAYFGGTKRRVRLLSLSRSAKFRKRKRRVQRRWVTVMTDTGMVKAAVNGMPTKRMPRIRKIVETPLGVAVHVDGSRVSVGAAAFRAHADKLRNGFGCLDVKASDVGRAVRLDLRFEDPFTKIIRASQLPPATKPLHVTIGLDEDGRPVQKDLRLPNLIVGAQGAGKSSEVWTQLDAILNARIPFRLRTFDPKGGVEFGPLDGAAWYYERNPTHWPVFLERAHRAMEARQAAMRAKGIKEVVEFTDDMPLDVMVVDELLTALAFGAGNAKVKVGGKQIKADDAFMVYLSTARAAGFTVIALSQLGQKDVIGPVRGLFGYATCLRVNQTEDELVNVILGQGASKAFPAHELPRGRNRAGIGYMATDEGVVKYRAAYLSDAERARVARRVREQTARLRAHGGDTEAGE